MNLQRQQIIYYAIKYNGEYHSVLNALSQNEAWQEVGDVAAITIIDSDYPVNFWQLRYPPLCLFYRGNKSLLADKKVAIVGSRDVGEEIRLLTKIIVKNLNIDYDILSGMAKGVDGYSHRAAIACGKKTIGILANGIKYCYPPENSDLYELMVKEHLLLSEYPQYCRPLRYHFPFRNRLIAALADKLIIPAAKEKSGTMITVDCALELNKDIYCWDDNSAVAKQANAYLLQQGVNVLSSLQAIKEL